LRRARRVPEAWSVDEIGLAIDQAYRLVGTVAGVDRGQFWSTLLLVAYYTGWRITAIMSLKIRNFDPTGRTLSADGSTQKHGAEEIRRIPADLANALSTVAGGRPPHDWLFDWPFDPNRRWKTLRRHLKKEILTPAGLNSKRWLFHKIRAAAATALESAGGNPTEFLGHSSPALYQASYRDPTKLSSPGPDQLLPKPLLRPRVMAS
jgi:integrase